MKKKIFGIIFSMATAAASLAGCTDTKEDPADIAGTTTPMREEDADGENNRSTGTVLNKSLEPDSSTRPLYENDALENLLGEYEYFTKDGNGKLIIAKSSYGYDISDYDSASSYRFLADSSNIETIENNRISIKYPEQVFSDGTVIFCYYVLEYSVDKINVYYGSSVLEEAQLLYHATKKKDADGDETVNAKEDSEMTAEELFDLFINGSISAVDSADLTSAFYMTDLNMDLYSVGERVDLDNDGENELIISGPYGGIYLDARDNKVYEFAAGNGTALILSYTYYNGAVWIMYSNSMNVGYESYHLERFEGADNLIAEMNFSEELADPNHSESETTYTWNGTIISYEEYAEFCSKIFAAQVNTNAD